MTNNETDPSRDALKCCLGRHLTRFWNKVIIPAKKEKVFTAHNKIKEYWMWTGSYALCAINAFIVFNIQSLPKTRVTPCSDTTQIN